MQLKVVSSSSKGNCYILENEQEALLIECGVKFPRIQQALQFNLSKVVGCLVSHEHKDHCCAVADVMVNGIKVFASEGTFGAMGIETGHYRAQVIRHANTVKIGNFRILPFELQHDCAEPLGFLINHPETGNVLFATDTYYLKYTFKDLNNLLIEANYSKEILDRKLATGESPDFLRNRVLQSHMSLDTCKEFLGANDLKAVNNIVLIHLSDSNSNASQFKKEIEQHTGKTVHIADVGLTINFNKKPF